MGDFVDERLFFAQSPEKDGEEGGKKKKEKKEESVEVFLMGGCD